MASRSDEVDGGVGTRGEAARPVSLLERALLRSALDFYGAAAAVLDLRADEPRVRWDPELLHAVRVTMAALERRIAGASRAGLSTERIAAITRLERELIEQIEARARDEAPET